MELVCSGRRGIDREARGDGFPERGGILCYGGCHVAMLRRLIGAVWGIDSDPNSASVASRSKPHRQVLLQELDLHSVNGVLFISGPLSCGTMFRAGGDFSTSSILEVYLKIYRNDKSFEILWYDYRIV